MTAPRELSPAEERRRRAVDSLGLRLDDMRRLHDLLADALSADVGGFEQFATIEPFAVRAIASDLVLTAADAVETNLGEAALHARAYSDHVGPNGRRMPGPDSSESDDLASLRAESEIVGFFRAIGSALDCLSAVAIGMLRLPERLQRADAALLAGGLDRLLERGLPGPDEQAAWAQRLADLISEERTAEPGWLEWLVEMRNRVIHRGRQLSTWLPRPVAQDRPPLYVRTQTDPAYLMRFEPHLRRKPWLPEIEALRQEAATEGHWFAEPTSTTFAGLLERVDGLSERVSRLLIECWQTPPGQMGNWAQPSTQWAAVEGGPPWRLERAAQFRGFDPAYAIPPVTSMRVSGRDVTRLIIAERLRTDNEPTA